MIKLRDIIKEIEINNPNISSEQIQTLWEEIYNKIETYWDDNNQDIMIDMDEQFSIINEKYFEKYGIDIVDDLHIMDINELSQNEKNRFYKDLLLFVNKTFK